MLLLWIIVSSGKFRMGKVHSVQYRKPTFSRHNRNNITLSGTVLICDMQPAVNILMNCFSIV